jgi:hypothetical protein
MPMFSVVAVYFIVMTRSGIPSGVTIFDSIDRP